MLTRAKPVYSTRLLNFALSTHISGKHEKKCPGKKLDKARVPDEVYKWKMSGSRINAKCQDWLGQHIQVENVKNGPDSGKCQGHAQMPNDRITHKFQMSELARATHTGGKSQEWLK